MVTEALLNALNNVGDNEGAKQCVTVLATMICIGMIGAGRDIQHYDTKEDLVRSLADVFTPATQDVFASYITNGNSQEGSALTRSIKNECNNHKARHAANTNEASPSSSSHEAELQQSATTQLQDAASHHGMLTENLFVTPTPPTSVTSSSTTASASTTTSASTDTAHPPTQPAGQIEENDITPLLKLLGFGGPGGF